MHQVVLTIEDQNIEDAMSEISRHEGINLQEFIMQAIRSFIKQKSGTMNTLDPIRHSTQINYQVTEDVIATKPFNSVENSAQFAKELRERAWRRSHCE